MTVFSKPSTSTSFEESAATDSSPSFLNSVRSMFSTIGNFVSSSFNRADAKIRSISINIKQSVVDYIQSLFIFLKSYLDSCYQSLINHIETFIGNFLEFIVQNIVHIYKAHFCSHHQVIMSYLSLLIFLLAVGLPSTSITTTGRFLMAILAGVTLYSKSVLPATVGTFFVLILSRLTAKMNVLVNVTTNNTTHPTQGTLQYDSIEVRKDMQKLLLNVVSTGVLFSAATTGIDIPTDAASWDKLLKRHSLLQRSFQFWEFGTSKVVELFEESARIVCKYIYNTEYTSFTHIQEVEDLIIKVMDLTSLDNQFKIGKDEELSTRIELMYIQYLQLCKIYAADSNIRKKLEIISGPLIAYYRRVTNKNPRANAMRKEPVVIAITGGTGLGKTYLATGFQQDLLKICGKYRPDECLSGQIYARCIEQEFWDGYTGQPIVVFDDFGQQVDSLNNPNKENFELIRAGNIFPYMLHSAELAEKANNPFLADFIYINTNLPEFKPVSIISADALNRRIHLKYEMHIITEVQTDCDLKMLDFVKLKKYRSDNNLNEADLSHVYFLGPGLETLTYEELIIKISLQYKRNVEDFESRKKIAFIKKEETLPKGCYSSDSKWVLQSDIPMFGEHNSELHCTTAAFFNQESHVQKEILRQGLKIHNSQNFALGQKDSIEDFLTSVRLHQHLFFQQELDKTAIVPLQVLKNYAFEKFDKIDKKLFVQTRYGKYLATQVPNLTKVQADNLKKYKERPDHVHTSNDNMYDFEPEDETTWQYYKRQCFWHLYNIFLHPDSTFQKYGHILSYITLGITVVSIINSFREMWTNTGLFGTKCMVRDPVFTYVARTIRTNSFEDMLVYFGSPFVGVSKLKKVTKYLHIFYLLSNFSQYALHYCVHSLQDPSCEHCKDFQQFYNLKPNIPESDLEDIDVSKLVKDIEEKKKDLIVQDTLANMGVEGSASSNKPCNSNETEKFESQQLNSTKILISEELEGSAASSNKPENSRLVEKFESEEVLPIGTELFKGYKSPAFESAKLEGLLCPQTKQLIDKCISNTWLCFVSYDGENYRNGRVFMIKGRKAIINFHYIELISNHFDKCEDKSSFKIGFSQVGKDLCIWTDIETLVMAKPIYRGHFKTELCIFTMPKEFPISADFSKHLIKAQDLSKLGFGTRLIVAKCSNDGDKVWVETREGDFTVLDTIEVPSLIDPGQKRIYPHCARYNISTAEGDCGSPVFINNNAFSRKVLGFHFAGIAGGGSCGITTYDDVVKHLENELTTVEPKLAVMQAEKEILSHLAPPIVGYVESPVTHPCQTKLTKSLVFECLGPHEMEPAVLQPALYNDGPMLKGFEKYNLTQCVRLSKFVLQQAKDNYFNTNIAPFPHLEFEKEILSFEHACMGLPQAQYIVGLKRSKSAGYPYMLNARKGKTDWLGEDEWDFSSEKCEQLRQDCRVIEQQCKQGIIPEVIFVATLKDEKRTLSKVLNKKTRVFSASPLHFSIVFRKYFAGFQNFIMRNKIQNECCVGTNVHSTDWGDILKKLTFPIGEQEYFLAGDFANFDGDLLVDILYLILEIVNDFYCDEFEIVRKCLWECLIHSKQLLHHIVIQLFNGQPSGNPATSILNSIYVSLLFRYVYYSLMRSGKIPQKFAFHRYCRLVTYGDDHIFSIHPSLAEILTPYMFKVAIEELRHGYTDSFKNQILEDCKWSTYEEVSFLKRKFSKTSAFVYAPLDLLSIRETVNWIQVCSSPLEATIDNCKSAFYELCHHDEETFNVYSKAIIANLKLQRVSLMRPNYDLIRWQLRKGLIADLLCEVPWA